MLVRAGIRALDYFPPASRAVSNQTSGDAVHPKIPLPILRP